jgi:uridine kinase
MEQGCRLPVGSLADAARLVSASPPSCGRVRVVTVDGHAGSGKTTFAGHLSARLGGAPVVHLDDLATHEELFGWVERLESQVLRPLSLGVPARYPVYDWEARKFAGEQVVEPADVVLVEGVGAGRGRVRPHAALTMWMDMPASVAHERGQRRDGPALAEFWRGWTAAEARHFAHDPSKPFARLLVRAVPDGYEVCERCPRLP